MVWNKSFSSLDRMCLTLYVCMNHVMETTLIKASVRITLTGGYIKAGSLLKLRSSCVLFVLLVVFPAPLATLVLPFFVRFSVHKSYVFLSLFRSSWVLADQSVTVLWDYLENPLILDVVAS